MIRSLDGLDGLADPAHGYSQGGDARTRRVANGSPPPPDLRQDHPWHIDGPREQSGVLRYDLWSKFSFEALCQCEASIGFRCPSDTCTNVESVGRRVAVLIGTRFAAPSILAPHRGAPRPDLREVSGIESGFVQDPAVPPRTWPSCRCLGLCASYRTSRRRPTHGMVIRQLPSPMWSATASASSRAAPLTP